MTSDIKKTAGWKLCMFCYGEFPPELNACPKDGTPLSQLAQNSLVGSIFDGKYEILNVIGGGGMGLVYRANHHFMNRIVAIKVLHKKHIAKADALKRFQIEAQTACTLLNPNIVTVYDFGISPTGEPFMVMDFIAGQSLQQILDTEGMLSVPRALNIFIQLSLALACAHGKGILHRDIKPSNIMIDSVDGQPDFVKIVDFGIVKLLNTSNPDSVNLTRAGEVFGSPLYMSPEQCMGHKLDARADIYSVGCVMYRAFSGAPIYRTDDVYQVMDKHVSEMPVSFRSLGVELPPLVELIIFRTLAKDPGQRYQSMEDLAAALEQCRYAILMEADGEATRSRAGTDTRSRIAKTADAHRKKDSPTRDDLKSALIEFRKTLADAEVATSMSSEDASDAARYDEPEPSLIVPMHHEESQPDLAVSMQYDLEPVVNQESSGATSANMSPLEGSVASVPAPGTSATILVPEANAAILSPDAHPAMSTSEVAPPVSLPEWDFSLPVPEGDSVSVPEGEPAVSLPEWDFSLSVPEWDFSLSVPEGDPAVSVPEGDPAVSVPEGDPAVSVPEGDPAVSVPEGDPAVSVPEGDPALSLPEGDPALSLPEGDPALSMLEDEPPTSDYGTAITSELAIITSELPVTAGENAASPTAQQSPHKTDIRSRSVVQLHQDEDVSDIARRVSQITVSAIKQMPMLAAKLRGCVSLGQGIPSFNTPDFIRDAVIHQLQTNPSIGKYTLQPGLPALRQAVAEDLKRTRGLPRVDPEREVFISCGGMEALAATLATIVERGDEVILPSPTYASHIEQVLFAEGEPRFVPMLQPGWQLDVDGIRAAITSKTKAIVLCNPVNPTGTVFSPVQLRAVADLVVEHDLFLVMDEAYDFLLYDGMPFFSPVSLPELKEHVIVVCSFSKRFFMTGWRVGFMYACERIIRQVLKVHDAFAICAPTISQYAALAALKETNGHDGKGDKLVLELVAALDHRRNLTCQRLDALPDLFQYVKPGGGYYVFPEISVAQPSIDFALRLLNDAHVVTIPGSAFGPTGEGHLRLSFGAKEEELNEAFDRIERFWRAQ